MTIAARRSVLALFDQGGAPGEVANAGLVLDRYLHQPVGTVDARGRKNGALGALYDRVSSAPPPPIYPLAFARWQRALAGATGDAGHLATGDFAVNGRMIVGLGAESVREAGITLHRLYGVPVIPGSALKGLARHYARHRVEREQPGDPTAARELRLLFGDTDEASYLTFCDAWYVPASAPDDRPLARDVITVHHPRYYGSAGRSAAPWDFDDPNPTPFLSARGTYRLAVLGPNARWATFALGLLQSALADWGVGGKTAGGYGRAVAAAPAAATTPQPPQGGAAAAPDHPFLATIAAVTAANLPGRARNLYDQAMALPDGPRRAGLLALRERMRAAGMFDRWLQDTENPKREWVRQMQRTLDGAA